MPATNPYKALITVGISCKRHAISEIFSAEGIRLVIADKNEINRYLKALNFRKGDVVNGISNYYKIQWAPNWKRLCKSRGIKFNNIDKSSSIALTI